MYLRLLWRVSRWIDRQIESRVKRGWKPTGKSGDCDPSCDYCGYLCSRCGRPV